MSALKYRWQQSKWIINNTNDLKFIGKGSFGDVFSFYEEKPELRKALKVVEYERYRKICDDEEISTKDWFKEAKKEIDILKELGRYEHILTLDDYHLDYDYDCIYMVTDLAEMNLKSYIEKSKNNLRNSQLKKIIKSVLLGLQYAHSKKILHRDIKLENILVRTNGTFIISDWGITRLLAKRGTQTHRTMVMGTLTYLPPEVDKVIPNQTVTNMEKSDAYSAGLVFLICCGCLELDLKDIYRGNSNRHDNDVVERLKDFVKPRNISGLEELIKNLTLFDVSERFDIERAVKYCLERRLFEEVMCIKIIL